MATPDPRTKLVATVDQLQSEVDSLSTQVGVLFGALVCVFVIVVIIDRRVRA